MGGFYDRMAATAKRLLTNYGKDYVINRVVNGAYNPATGTMGQTSSSFTVKGRVFDYNDFQISQSGGLIKAGDRYLMAAEIDLSFIPDPTTDRVTLDDGVWSVLRLYRPVDEKVFVRLHFRRL